MMRCSQPEIKMLSPRRKYQNFYRKTQKYDISSYVTSNKLWIDCCELLDTSCCQQKNTATQLPFPPSTCVTVCFITSSRCQVTKDLLFRFKFNEMNMVIFALNFSMFCTHFVTRVILGVNLTPGSFSCIKQHMKSLHTFVWGVILRTLKHAIFL